MGCKSFLGRYGLTISAIVFTAGVLVSTLSPSWLSYSSSSTTTTSSSSSSSASDGMITEMEFGPFYSRNRTCVFAATATESSSNCSDWTTHEIQTDDCDSFINIIPSSSSTTTTTTSENDDNETAKKDKVCRQHNTWRILAMFCNFIVVITGILVLVATCTQCLTCGCCGGSFDLIAMIAYWIEVFISIVAWSFCISVVTTIQDQDLQTFGTEQLNDFSEVQGVEDLLVKGSFLWGFWLFLFSGTIMGAICAILADWAAEGSLLKCLTNCLSCLFCCKK